MSTSIPDRVAERVAAAVVAGHGGCHVSTYSTGSHGYAQIGWHDDARRLATTAHRAAWVAHTGGQIPDGMTVDHTCKNRRCVRPDHLRLLSNYENARRTAGRDWPLGECANGHSNDHLRREPQGRLRCHPCQRAIWTASNARRRPAA